MFVQAGSWVAYSCAENAVLFEQDIMTDVHLVRGLYATARAWIDRRLREGEDRSEESRDRARNHLTHGPTFTFSSNVSFWLAVGLNRLSQVSGTFSFSEPRQGGESVLVWRMREGFSPDLESERDRVGAIGFYASLAREFRKAGPFLSIEGVENRNWGRMVTFCQANLGTSTYQSEQDKRRGGPPSGKRKTPEERERGEGWHESDEDILFTGPPTQARGRGRRGSTRRGKGRAGRTATGPRVTRSQTRCAYVSTLRHDVHV